MPAIRRTTSDRSRSVARVSSIAGGEAASRTIDEPAPTRPSGDGEAPTVDRHPVHRLRALSRAEQRWAVAAGVALLLAPLVALAIIGPGWVPANDPALMGLRALDAGTTRTPLLGQPSQSRVYADAFASVHHPGPLHFYLMALPVRLLGGPAGMLAVSVAITGGCLLVSAWAVFRQLGRTAGLFAAAALALVAFTTGASSLLNPVSSNIAGYPLLATAVLSWCVAAGDVRLLPLAAGVASFTAQQHLAVVPATMILCLGGVGLLAARRRRYRQAYGPDPAGRRELFRWSRRAAVLVLVLWSPVLVQQAFGNAGNLGEMLWFAQHGNSDTLGLESAVRQLAHALGLPPLLGRTDLHGSDLLVRPSVFTWVSAAVVLTAVVVVCRRARRDEPRRASLGAAVGLVTVAGLFNGSSVPVGLEQNRLAFYHWAFALAFLIALVLGLAVAGPVARWSRAGRPLARPLLATAAVVAVATPSLVNPALDRRTNEPRAAYSPIDHTLLTDLADGIEGVDERLGDHTLLVSRHEPPYAGLAPALSFELAQRGIVVRHPLTDRFFVHDERLVDRERLEGGLVLVVERALPGDVPSGGELVTEVDVESDFDVAAYRSLVATARRADEVRIGAAAERAVDDLPANFGDLVWALLDALEDDPRGVLQQRLLLEFLHEHPIEQPAFDPRDVARVLDTLDAWDGATAGPVTGMAVYHLDREEIVDYARTAEIGRRADEDDRSDRDD